jgi:hypothetical protein
MTSDLLGGANKPWKGSEWQRMSLERHYHAWTCKVGYKERLYIDPCAQCINTNINVYPSYCCSKYILVLFIPKLKN